MVGWWFRSFCHACLLLFPHWSIWSLFFSPLHVKEYFTFFSFSRCTSFLYCFPSNFNHLFTFIDAVPTFICTFSYLTFKCLYLHLISSLSVSVTNTSLSLSTPRFSYHSSFFRVPNQQPCIQPPHFGSTFSFFFPVT